MVLTACTFVVVDNLFASGDSSDKRTHPYLVEGQEERIKQFQPPLRLLDTNLVDLYGQKRSRTKS